MWDIIADSEIAFGGIPPKWEQGLKKLERYLLNTVTSGSKCCYKGRWEGRIYFSAINE